MDPSKIEQCESCNSALTEGYVEMNDPLTDIRSRICFDCGIRNLLIQRALHDDDLLAAGMME